MNYLQSQIDLLKTALLSVSRGLDNLTFETFDTIFPDALNTIKEVHKFRSVLAAQYSAQELAPYEKDLFGYAKQIEEKFDNIIGVFSEEEKKLEKELSISISQKKLSTYKR